MPNKFQDVDFRNVEEFLEYLPQHERAVVDALRELVLGCIPRCTEKLSYNVPFYSRHSAICFIWPPAIPWGKLKQDGVRLGFNKGYLLSDELGYLDRGSRKQVFCKDFKTIAEIEKDADILKALLFEAYEIDEQAGLAKKNSKKRISF